MDVCHDGIVRVRRIDAVLQRHRSGVGGERHGAVGSRRNRERVVVARADEAGRRNLSPPERRLDFRFRAPDDAGVDVGGIGGLDPLGVVVGLAVHDVGAEEAGVGDGDEEPVLDLVPDAVRGADAGRTVVAHERLVLPDLQRVEMYLREVAQHALPVGREEIHVPPRVHRSAGEIAGCRGPAVLRQREALIRGVEVGPDMVLRAGHGAGRADPVEDVRVGVEVPLVEPGGAETCVVVVLAAAEDAGVPRGVHAGENDLRLRAGLADDTRVDVLRAGRFAVGNVEVNGRGCGKGSRSGRGAEHALRVLPETVDRALAGGTVVAHERAVRPDLHRIEAHRARQGERAVVVQAEDVQGPSGVAGSVLQVHHLRPVHDDGLDRLVEVRDDGVVLAELPLGGDVRVEVGGSVCACAAAVGEVAGGRADVVPVAVDEVEARVAGVLARTDEALVGPTYHPLELRLDPDAGLGDNAGVDILRAGGFAPGHLEVDAGRRSRRGIRERPRRNGAEHGSGKEPTPPPSYKSMHRFHG